MEYIHAAEKAVEGLKRFDGVSRIILFEPLNPSSKQDLHLDIALILDEFTASLPLDEATNLPLGYYQRLQEFVKPIQEGILYTMHVVPCIEQIYRKGIKPKELPGECYFLRGIPVVRYDVNKEDDK